MASFDDVDPKVFDHLRSADEVCHQAAANGRPEDCWKIYRNSAQSAIAAAPRTPLSGHLNLVMGVAERQRDPVKRAAMMQHAFHELLAGEERPQSNRMVPRATRSQGPPQGARVAWSAPRLGEVEPMRNGSPGVAAAMGQMGQRRAPLSRGSSRPPSPQLIPPITPEISRHLQITPGGHPMLRAASAPYVAATPHASEPYFSGHETDDGHKTSHYTKLGAPRTNSHYKNTLPGANTKFHDADDWQTSNNVFFGNSRQYPLDVPQRRQDPNFQYVNGDARQGLATWQRTQLPGYHRSKAEINGLR
eukprot:TRINITY_DN28743_c0_g1_i1.p1 TRINITY_DN28743_c0_g1~~TRINITY_DN28743_c0_g1_i1.p1  ORF type:complete len:304 (-),score=30.79 TRINITY_DN28743_c0_g1_i1:106-1017(-)